MEGPSGEFRQLQAEGNWEEDTKDVNKNSMSVLDVNTEQILNEKTIMHTFYEPNGPCCGMTLDGHQNVVQAWEESWRARGLDTKNLTKADAVAHPDF